MAIHYTIQKAQSEELEFMWEMLALSVFVTEEHLRLTTEDILNDEMLAGELKGWGRKGDVAFIAVTEGGEKMGAIWMRRFNERNKTYGYINEYTPVIAGFAIKPEYRGQGVGTKLLQALMDIGVQSGYSSLSLSCDPQNPALKLYEKFGFEKVGITGTSWDMKAVLTDH